MAIYAHNARYTNTNFTIDIANEFQKSVSLARTTGLALFTTKSVMTKGLEGLVTNLRIFRKPNLTLLIALNM